MRGLAAIPERGEIICVCRTSRDVRQGVASYAEMLGSLGVARCCMTRSCSLASSFDIGFKKAGDGFGGWERCGVVGRMAGSWSLGCRVMGTDAGAVVRFFWRGGWEDVDLRRALSS